MDSTQKHNSSRSNAAPPGAPGHQDPTFTTIRETAPPAGHCNSHMRIETSVRTAFAHLSCMKPNQRVFVKQQRSSEYKTPLWLAKQRSKKYECNYFNNMYCLSVLWGELNKMYCTRKLRNSQDQQLRSSSHWHCELGKLLSTHTFQFLKSAKVGGADSPYTLK